MTFPTRGRTTATRVLVGLVTLLALVTVFALPATANAAESAVAKTATDAVAAARAPAGLALVTRVSSAGRVPSPISLRFLLITLALAVLSVLLRPGGEAVDLVRSVLAAPLPLSRATRPRSPRGPPALLSTQARRRPAPRDVDRPTVGP